MLDDPSVEEIWLNSPSQVFCARNGRSELTTLVLGDDEVRGIIERMLVSSGRPRGHVKPAPGADQHPLDDPAHLVITQDQCGQLAAPGARPQHVSRRGAPGFLDATI